MAFPDTSRMQCFPWWARNETRYYNPGLDGDCGSGSPVRRRRQRLPAQLQFWQTTHWSRRGSRWTGRPRWIYYPECLSPFVHASPQSGSPGRRSHSLAWDGSYLRGRTEPCRFCPCRPAPLTVCILLGTHEVHKSRTCEETQRWGHRLFCPSLDPVWSQASCSGLGRRQSQGVSTQTEFKPTLWLSSEAIHLLSCRMTGS